MYTAHQPEIHGVVRDWRKLFDEWQRRIDKHMYVAHVQWASLLVSAADLRRVDSKNVRFSLENVRFSLERRAKQSNGG